MKAGELGVSEERVWPPDPLEHLIADAELVLLGGEVQPGVEPVLTEVKVQGVILVKSTSLIVQ